MSQICRTMIAAKINIRVRYSETDQMGFVYYGNYAQYFEIGRVEALKEIGISYRELEEKGYALPVRNLNIIYHRAATYDDEITISTTILKKPTNKIAFEYEIHRGEELLVTGDTTLFFIDRDKKACKPPSFFMDQIAPFFN